MARPRKADEDNAAALKIENAFWKLLEKHPYQEITVLMVVQEADVNRNSFYYHYENIGDLAKKAFSNAVGTDLSKNLISELVSRASNTRGTEKFSAIPQALPYARKIMLCARSQSPLLHRLVKELISDAWLSALCIDKNKLSQTEQLEVGFIFSGLVALLGSEIIKNNPLALTKLPETAMGKCAVKTLKAMQNDV